MDDPAGPGDVVGHEDPRPDEDDAAQEPSHRRGGAGGGEGRGRDAAGGPEGRDDDAAGAQQIDRGPDGGERPPQSADGGQG